MAVQNAPECNTEVSITNVKSFITLAQGVKHFSSLSMMFRSNKLDCSSIKSLFLTGLLQLVRPGANPVDKYLKSMEK
jgi:hypothetical protein